MKPYRTAIAPATMGSHSVKLMNVPLNRSRAALADLVSV
jgi:hypothetical protein